MTSFGVRNPSIFLGLLKDIVIDRPNQVWQVDITYIKIKGGFVYLVCLIDVCSRKIMDWSLSIFLDTISCLNAFNGALEVGHPEIINSDQGCQFIAHEWCDSLKKHNIKISMDSKVRWADNVYTERFWRTIKYELVYLHRFDTVEDAKEAVAHYIEFYNEMRPH